MTRKEKNLVTCITLVGAILLLPQMAGAMHVMEGYLPPAACALWAVVALPFFVAGVFAIRRTVRERRKALLLLAMAGAFVFLISSLKIPSVTGSCSHMTGTGLAAILFGVPVTAVLGAIVLLFQTLLLGHGGLTTLGANLFSMAIAGPLVTWGLYQLGKKLKLHQMTNIFMAASLGDLFTYCVTSFQLALTNPSASGGVAASMVKFLGVFAPTQLPLAIIEGILTMLIIIGLETYAKPELRLLGYQKEVA